MELDITGELGLLDAEELQYVFDTLLESDEVVEVSLGEGELPPVLISIFETGNEFHESKSNVGYISVKKREKNQFCWKLIMYLQC